MTALEEAMEEAAAAAFARRDEPGRALAGQAGRVARAGRAMAARFHRGGRLLVFGNGAQATDAAHIAVEFVHPVIVGKRALPAFSLAADPNALSGLARAAGFDEVYAAGLATLADAGDIAVGLSPDGECENVLRGLVTAREMGLLTVALTGGGGGRIARSAAVQHPLVVPARDPRIVKEINVTTYHVLWELVHVFLDRPAAPPAESPS